MSDPECSAKIKALFKMENYSKIITIHKTHITLMLKQLTNVFIFATSFNRASNMKIKST